MLTEQTIAAAEEAAVALAALAGPPALLAGAADPAAGPAVLADLLAHELAAGHRLMLRLSGAAHGVLDWSRDMGDGAATAGRDGSDLSAADLAAARLAGGAGRLMEQVRHGVVALRRSRPRSAAAAEAWIGLSWGDGQCSPEEFARRLAAAKTAHDAADSVPAAASPLAPRDQAARAAAAESAAALADEAGVADLAAVLADEVRGPAFLARLFGHQLGACHGLAMRLNGCANRALDRAVAASAEPAAALALAGAATRLADRFRRGQGTVQRLAAGPAGTPPPAALFWSGPKGDPTVPANDAAAVSEVDPTNLTATPVGDGGRPQGAGPTKVGTPNRGRLRNDNPSGDYLTAPRCGAQTRAHACCRQPAMANGRCRFHGGKSTGPRTAAGRAKSRTARLTHGAHSAEIIDLRRAAAARARRLRALFAMPILVGAAPCGRPVPEPIAQQQGAHAGAPLRHGAVAPFPAGHGVHPQESGAAPSITAPPPIRVHRRSSAAQS